MKCLYIQYLHFFLQEHESTSIYLLFISVNPGGAQHHMYSVSNGLSGEVASGFGFAMNHSTVSMGLGYFSPDHSGFLQVPSRSHCVVFLLYSYKHISFLIRIQFHLGA